MQTIEIKDLPLKDSKPGALNLLACKCPRCRKGDMFQHKNAWNLKHTMKMNKECPVCKQPFDIEVGFYYGSSYISYGATVALSVFTFAAWWLTIGFGLEDNRFLFWVITNAVLLIVTQPYLMRVARTGWLAFFVRYDKNWRANPPKPVERTNDSQQNNW
ncbi:MAG: DUF983 domain-containing protein [Chitinophagaceae bacterium]